MYSKMKNICKYPFTWDKHKCARKQVNLSLTRKSDNEYRRNCFSKNTCELKIQDNNKVNKIIEPSSSVVNPLITPQLLRSYPKSNPIQKKKENNL